MTDGDGWTTGSEITILNTGSSNPEIILANFIYKENDIDLITDNFSRIDHLWGLWLFDYYNPKNKDYFFNFAALQENLLLRVESLKRAPFQFPQRDRYWGVFEALVRYPPMSNMKATLSLLVSVQFGVASQGFLAEELLDLVVYRREFSSGPVSFYQANLKLRILQSANPNNSLMDQGVLTATSGIPGSQSFSQSFEGDSPLRVNALFFFSRTDLMQKLVKEKFLVCLEREGIREAQKVETEGEYDVKASDVHYSYFLVSEPNYFYVTLLVEQVLFMEG